MKSFLTRLFRRGANRGRRPSHKPARRHGKPGLEALEARELLSGTPLIVGAICPYPAGISLTNGVLAVVGTSGPDTAAVTGGLTVYQSNGGTVTDFNVVATLNGVTQSYRLGNVQSIAFYGFGGNDVFDASRTSVPVWADGGDGDDTLIGGHGSNTLHGGNGNDRLYSGDGYSYLYGEAGQDLLQAGSGGASLDGGDGADVQQDIGAKWASLGYQNSPLGWAVTDQTATPDGVGLYNHFQGGSIYWTPSTGAHVVWGAIRDKWSSVGWERSPLGYPTTDELTTPDGVGRYNHFQGGSIYWTPSTGAHIVWGAIRDKWASLGWERSPLGYPTTDELTTPDGVGRYNHFQGGSIYWTPTTGAHVVWGAIRDTWASLGWERGSLGYPVSDEMDATGGRINYFQHGSIFWNATTGAVSVTSLNVMHVHAIKVSDSDGSFTALITPQQVKQYVDKANTVYAGTGIQLAFNPNDYGDFSTLASDQVNQMSYAGNGFNPAADPAQAVATQYPDQLVLFFRYGAQYKDGSGNVVYTARTSMNKSSFAWQPTGNGFSGKNYDYVAMPSFNSAEIGLLAHEAGHYLGLRHTFVGDGDNVTNTASKAISYIMSHGGTAAALDGDNVSLYPGDDPITDTNPDPGTNYYTTYVSSDTINGPSTFTITQVQPFKLTTLTWTFTPPRSNLMSYYNCPYPTVTFDQAMVMNKWYRMRFADHSWQAGTYLVGNSGNGGEDDDNVNFLDGAAPAPSAGSQFGTSLNVNFLDGAAPAPSAGSRLGTSLSAPSAVDALFAEDRSGGMRRAGPARFVSASPPSPLLTTAARPSALAGARPAAPLTADLIAALARHAARRDTHSGAEAAFWDVLSEESDVT